MVLKNPFSRGGPETASAAFGERESFLGRCRGWCVKWFGADKALGLIALLVLIAGIGKLASGYGILPGFDLPVTSVGKWQAVFLVNNQVYFGHLQNYNSKYVVLKDVYYLQVSQLQPPQAQPQLNLIKLGQELHGPEDHMFIPKDRILFLEDMRPDAQVVQAIESTRR